MAKTARRRRSTTRKTTSFGSKARRAGLLAHNARLGAAVNRRNTGETKYQLGFNAAKIQRVRRKGRIANPRTAHFKARGLAIALEHGGYRGSEYRITAIPSKLSPRGAFERLHPRGHDGRFIRKRVGR